MSERKNGWTIHLLKNKAKLDFTRRKRNINEISRDAFDDVFQDVEKSDEKGEEMKQYRQQRSEKEKSWVDHSNTDVKIWKGFSQTPFKKGEGDVFMGSNSGDKAVEPWSMFK